MPGVMSVHKGIKEDMEGVKKFQKLCCVICGWSLNTQLLECLKSSLIGGLERKIIRPPLYLEILLYAAIPLDFLLI